MDISMWPWSLWCFRARLSSELHLNSHCVLFVCFAMALHHFTIVLFINCQIASVFNHFCSMGLNVAQITHTITAKYREICRTVCKSYRHVCIHSNTHPHTLVHFILFIRAFSMKIRQFKMSFCYLETARRFTESISQLRFSMENIVKYPILEHLSNERSVSQTSFIETSNLS